MPELDKKAASVFAGKIVRKDLVRKVKIGASVPRWVALVEDLAREARCRRRHGPSDP
jgi:predicted ATP-dependent Lon-type protease